MTRPRIFPLGDHAITVAFGNEIDEEINQSVFSVFRYLKKQKFDFILDVIPAYASLSVVYDVMRIRNIGVTNSYDYMHDLLQNALQQAPHVMSELRNISVPVCYHESLGPDLTTLSQQRKVAIEEIIQIHSSSVYRVYMLGFLPGFTYMGKVHDKIAMPRKSVPSKSVPAGSVGIAGIQTGIYPVDSPGGWNIIGRTPLKIFEAHNEHPCFFEPGDQVKFEPITLDEFLQHESNYVI
ncbi:MAG TPA: 5-oxoprolinase subunit PxpB [Parafilimonas sp.]|nr:5-oxoprolinase subunit PxpB [Parafilimonas sp.]